MISYIHSMMYHFSIEIHFYILLPFFKSFWVKVKYLKYSFRSTYYPVNIIHSFRTAAYILVP